MTDNQKADLDKIRHYAGTIKNFKDFWDQQAGENTNAYDTPARQGYDIHPTRKDVTSKHWKDINESIKFKKTFDSDQWGNIYTASAGDNNYELYRERTYKRNGTSAADGDWIILKNGQTKGSFSTIKKAKQAIMMDSIG